ncbi:CobW GTPase involved in cobalt insertion for B12 biosynthesis [Richelia intracellularis HM01]|nr:CobW GTPase involved in cobalt insertion for B12 biosynthesis [Richelia intracellularis HM01]
MNDMGAKIPVTIITGFLGSGKTTLIRHLLENNQGKRFAVLVNEFGELGIDGELLKSCQIRPEDGDINNRIFELTNGCLCCTVQEEFLPTMQKLLQSRNNIDYILIETSGLALPKPLIKAFRWHEIRSGATVDAVVTVVDCAAVAVGAFASNPDVVVGHREADKGLEHEAHLKELFEDQLASADLVVINKTDLVDKTTKVAVETLVKQELSGFVKVIDSCEIKLEPSLLLGFNAAAEDNLNDRPSHHDIEDDHNHDEEIVSAHFVLDRTYNPNELLRRLRLLTQEYDIYRIKGFVDVPNRPMRLVVQGVGRRFDHFYDRLWRVNETRQTTLVFIGKNLDTAAIRLKLV